MLVLIRLFYISFKPSYCCSYSLHWHTFLIILTKKVIVQVEFANKYVLIVNYHNFITFSYTFLKEKTSFVSKNIPDVTVLFLKNAFPKMSNTYREGTNFFLFFSQLCVIIPKKNLNKLILFFSFLHGTHVLKRIGRFFPNFQKLVDILKF